MSAAPPRGRAAWAPALCALGLFGLLAWTGQRVPLFADEAYYLAWSRRLAWGYFDHPPAIAGWIALWGGQVRLAGVAGLALTALLIADALRRLGSPHWRWAPAALLATPAGFGLGLIVTPDLPLCVAWAGLAWAVVARRPSAAGLFLALGLWSKSTAVLAAPGVLLAFGGQAPRALVIAAVLYAPHLVWSAQHGGDPFAYQSGRAVLRFSALELIAGLALLVGPGQLYTLSQRMRRAQRGTVRGGLVALIWPTLLLFGLLSLVVKVELNWPVGVWPVALILLLDAAPRGGRSARAVRAEGRCTRLRRGLERAGAFLVRHQWRLSAGVTLALALLLSPVLAARSPHAPPRDPQRWAHCVAQVGGGLPVVAARYQEAALLEAAGVEVLWRRAEGHRKSQYDRWPMKSAGGCGFLHLAGRLTQGHCLGRPRAQPVCGRSATLCLCP